MTAERHYLVRHHRTGHVSVTYAGRDGSRGSCLLSEQNPLHPELLRVCELALSPITAPSRKECTL
jgi:hypothetical protein